MSKMPAKKKSCFQITSVTQAQVAASSITDDTESLDDPDESRTEDVSSEIFDVSRADFEPEVCDISSSEETLNNVGETETHIPQDGQLPTVSGPPNGGFAFRNVGVAGVVVNQQVLGAAVPTGQLPTAVAGVVQHPALVAAGGVSNASVSAPQPTPAASSVSSTTTSTTSCSSRFRVIKLDHGTGEPFRRGRWTCMEFYERDSEGSVITRTVDSIRHANALDHSMDRDSGLGATGGSAVPTTLSGPGPDPVASDCAFVSGQQLHPEPQPQSYSGGPQTVGGAFQQAGYPLVPGSIAVPVQAQGGIQPMAPQSLVPPGTNGVQPSMPLQHVQNSPCMPSAGQAQHFGYPVQQQQLVPGQQLLGQPTLAPPGALDYRPQHLPAQTFPVGTPVSQAPSSVLTPAPGTALGPQPGEGMGPAGPQGLLQQPGGVGGGGAATALAGAPQQPGAQYQPPGPSRGPPASLGLLTAVPGVLSMGALGAGAGGPAMNHVPSPTAQSPLSQSQGPHTGLDQGESVRRLSDTPPQPFPVPGKDLMKPLIPEGLALTAPTVNSLFGIPITIDGDEDGASGASVVAIDNKIEQAMDLVKSHLMYAVREEVEVLKEQIKELYERNSVLERENAVLKSLANSDQLSQLSIQPSNPPGSTPPQQPEAPPPQPNVSSA
ncbi:TSC22 domain family protein 2-like [Conger conger]|uniref:TSC22 domain family protein 2-like n=1 Tax=Conger conger TaxID=82655 RepID=UPI002A5A5671|nr:TSC22 domain family protein 2-like [Conger conger]